MKHTKHRITEALLGIATILTIATAFSVFSGKYEPEVMRGLDAPTVPLTVSQEAPLVIPIQHQEKPISGIILYAANEKTGKSMLRTTVQDEHGTIVATQRRQRLLYQRGESIALHIYFPGIRTSKQQKLFFHVEPHNTEPIALIANKGEGDLPLVVYSLLYKGHVSFGARQGIIIGATFALSLILLFFLRLSEKKQWIGAGIIVCVFAILTTLPYIYRQEAWGINDWDYRHSLSHIYQAIIQEHHQFPFWNPYICGGTAGLGDPEFALFTPSFLLQTLLGVENGTGIAVSVSFIIVGLGMLFLAKEIKLKPFPALLSASIVLFCSALMLKATEGHTTIIFAYMWVPWMLWSWLIAYRASSNTNRTIWTLACGIFLTLALLQGGIYILSYTALSLVGITILSSQRWRAAKISAYAIVLMIGISSFQLIPTLYFLKEFPDEVFVGSAYTYMNLWDIFFGRNLQNTWIIKNQVSRWHEYGAYIGYGTFALILLGASYVRTSRMVRILLFGMFVTLIVSSLGPLFESILHLLQFLPRSNISRLVLFTVLCGSLVAGFGLQRIISLLPPALRLLPILILGYIGIDLISLAYPIAEQGFAVPRITKQLTHAPHPLIHISEQYEIRNEGHDTPRTYAAILQGYGTSSFCSVIGPKSAVSITAPNTPASDYVTSNVATHTELRSWSPNIIKVAYKASEPADISINTNYAKGWQTDTGVITTSNPRLTVRVPAGEGVITLQYKPQGMLLGIVVSTITVLVIIFKLGIIQAFFLRRPSNYTA